MKQNYRFSFFISLIINALALFLPNRDLSAQTDPSPNTQVRIDSIVLEGNRKTRPGLILRELEFRAGDTLAVSTIGATLEREAY